MLVIAKHGEIIKGLPASASHHSNHLHQSVQRISQILQCIKEDPDSRRQSARSNFSALPRENSHLCCL